MRRNKRVKLIIIYVYNCTDSNVIIHESNPTSYPYVAMILCNGHDIVRGCERKTYVNLKRVCYHNVFIHNYYHLFWLFNESNGTGKPLRFLKFFGLFFFCNCNENNLV